MTAVDPISAIIGAGRAPIFPTPAVRADTSGFGGMLADGLRQVDAKVATADRLMQAFAEGQAIPVHQVTLALEQARLAVELAAQVRARLVETYRDFMSMQL